MSQEIETAVAGKHSASMNVSIPFRVCCLVRNAPHSYLFLDEAVRTLGTLVIILPDASGNFRVVFLHLKPLCFLKHFLAFHY
jgi:hypothetical protein